MFIIVLAISVIAMITLTFNNTEIQKPSMIESRAHFDANNFAIYSSALTAYAQFNPMPTGTVISDTALNLPSGFIKGNWSNKIEQIGGNSVLLIYSNTPYPSATTFRNKDVLYFLESMLEESMSIGYTVSNAIMSNTYNNGTAFVNATGITIPNTTPLPDQTMIVYRFI